MATRSWQDLDPRSRRLLGIAGVVQVALFAAAQIDLARRPSSAVRGPKWAWRLGSFVNFLGPLAYFGWGQRR